MLTGGFFIDGYSWWGHCTIYLSNKVGVIKSPSKSFESPTLKWSSEIINE